jgi:hypothetical protein
MSHHCPTLQLLGLSLSMSKAKISPNIVLLPLIPYKYVKVMSP